VDTLVKNYSAQATAMQEAFFSNLQLEDTAPSALPSALAHALQELAAFDRRMNQA
jgi:hypothetical protein